MTQHHVRPDVSLFLNFLNSQPGPKMQDLPVAEARNMMLAMRDLADVETGEIAVIRNLSIPGVAGDIPARLYDAREERQPGPVMVFFHGGGFVIGDIDTHEPYCAEVARLLDLPVISVDYRLAPEHPFPAAPDDCEAAARWVADNIPCTALILSGDSAGGNLTIVTAMALRDHPASVPVIAQHPIYPAVSSHNDWQSYRDFNQGFLLTKEGMEWFMNAYQFDPEDRRANPLEHDQSGMPPTLVVTASLDPLRDQGRAYAQALKAAGVPTVHLEAEGNIHGYINLCKAIPSARDDIRSNMEALKTLLCDVMADA